MVGAGGFSRSRAVTERTKNHDRAIQEKESELGEWKAGHQGRLFQ